LKPNKLFPIVISSQWLATITSRSDVNTECGPKEHKVKDVGEWNWHQHCKHTKLHIEALAVITQTCITQ